MAVVYQTWFPYTTGEDQPFPGSLTFHAIFAESSQVEGNPFSMEIPFRSDPLKCVHDPIGWDQSGQDPRTSETRMEKIRL